MNMKTRKTLKLLVLSLMMFILGGCSKSKVKVGILLPVEHDALNLAKEGFMEGLKEGGFVNKQNGFQIIYENALGNESDLVNLSKSLVAKCDLTLGVGTGASVALQSAEINAGLTKPILFTAVTDPLDAELVDNLTSPSGFITGSSDKNPVEAQIGMILDANPNITNLGILYTQSETNSEVQANEAKTAAEDKGLTVTVMTCTDSSDLTQVAESLCGSGIQALYIPTDNVIAANANAVKLAVDNHNILTICGEEALMARCGHITLSINYFELGKQAGIMAAQILNKQKTVSQLPVKFMSEAECEYVMCSENIADANVTVAKEVTDKCRNIEAK